MSRKKLRISPEMNEDELRKEIYRDVWYNLMSDLRRHRRISKAVGYPNIREAINQMRMGCPV